MLNRNRRNNRKLGVVLPLCYLYVTSLLPLECLQTSRKSFIQALFQKIMLGLAINAAYLSITVPYLSITTTYLNNKQPVAE